MTHFTAAVGGALLPLPPTSKWPDGVFDVEMFKTATVRIVYFAPLGEDRQTAHHQDEVYVIIAGEATYCEAEQPAREVRAGDLLFAAAGVDHRFARIGEGFSAWVIFFGADPR